MIGVGSRVMHYIVSQQLIERLLIEEKEAFLLGGIAADASRDKEVSHFFEGSHDDYTRIVNYERFYEKYQDHAHQSYILGYYAHLITDHIWLTGFFQPWLKNRIEHDPSLHEQYHHDFSLLNRKLANYYNISVDTFENVSDTDIPHIDEVSGDDVKKLFSAIYDDLLSPKSESEPLKVFTMTQIVGYIETAIEVCTKKSSEK